MGKDEISSDGVNFENSVGVKDHDEVRGFVNCLILKAKCGIERVL
jgi:hypothetical protein